MDLETPVLNLIGVGPFVAKKLNRLGIKNFGDLLYHLPFRYEDFSNITAIAKLKPVKKPVAGVSKSQTILGFSKKPVLNEISCVKGIVKNIENTRAWKKRMDITTAIVEDKTGSIKAVWFNQGFILQNLKQGDEVYLAGKVKLGKSGIFLSSPIYEIADPVRSFASNGTRHTNRIVPIYQETIGLTSRWFRNFFAKNLQQIITFQKEFLPLEILKKHNLLPFQTALYQAHFPDSMEMAQKAKNRFAFEELFLIELFVLRERLKINQQKSPAIPIKADEIKKFVVSLPFKLTDSQKKCAWQILKDMEKPSQM